MNITSKIRSQKQFESADIINQMKAIYPEGIPTDFTLKAVFCRSNDEKWTFLIGKCDVGIHDKEDLIVYSDYAFVTKHYASADINKLLQEIGGAGMSVSDTPELRIVSDNNNIKWQWELIPSHVTPERKPIYQYSCDLKNNHNVIDMPLIGFDLPFFESSDKYIKHFMQLDNFHGHSDGRNGSIFLNIPNSSSSLVEIDGQITIQSINEDICAVGCLSDKEPLILHTGDNISLNDADLSGSEIWLINKNNEVLDYRSQLTWPHKIKNDDDEKHDSVIHTQIDQGEGLECEFKPYIDLLSTGNKKAFELEKTVCAFSNAHGGKLLLGVSDEGLIEGVDEKVCNTYHLPILESIEQYCKAINKRLYEALFNGQCYEIYPAMISGVYIVVVSVSISDQANYIRNIKQAFIRKGATSAKMAFADERNDYARNPFSIV
jgi:hypothetical protein